MSDRVKAFRDELALPKEITLPSGKLYTIRRLTPLDYIREGLTDIPNDFFRFILTVQKGATPSMSEEEQKKFYELFERFMTVTLDKGCIDPLCTLRYDATKLDTHLLWGEISPVDQEYIIGCIIGRINDQTENERRASSKPVS